MGIFTARQQKVDRNLVVVRRGGWNDEADGFGGVRDIRIPCARWNRTTGPLSPYRFEACTHYQARSCTLFRFLEGYIVKYLIG